MNLVGDGVANRVEPASASGLVEPALIVPALWILTFENVVSPLFVAQRIRV